MVVMPLIMKALKQADEALQCETYGYLYTHQ